MSELIKINLGTLKAVGDGLPVQGQAGAPTVTATVTGVGAVSATVVVRGSNDGAAWTTLATLSPNGSGSAVAVGQWSGDYAYLRADASALSAGASVTTTVAVDQTSGGGDVVGGGVVDETGRLASVQSAAGGAVVSRSYGTNGSLIREVASGPCYHVRPPVTLCDFALAGDLALASAAVTNATASLASPAVRSGLGQGYRVVTGTAAADRGTVTVASTTKIPALTAADTIVVPLYVEQINSGDQLIVFLSPDNMVSTSISSTVALSRFKQGWNFVELPVGAMTGTSTIGAAHNSIRLQIRHNNAGGAATIITVYGAWLTTGTGVGKVMLDFDDQFITQYTQAFAYMRTKGLVGNIAVIAQAVGKSAGQIDAYDYCTLDQLREMWAAGWDMMTHGYYPHNGAPLSSNEAAITADLASNKAYLADNGLTGAEDHYVFPAGQVVYPASLNALAANQFVGARTTSNQPTCTQVFGVDDVRLIGGYNIAAATGLATLQSAVDLAVNSGSTVILYGHRIVTPAVDTGNEITVADFRTLIDYIVTKRDAGLIDVVTRSQWVAGLGNTPQARPSFDRSSARWVQV